MICMICMIIGKKQQKIMQSCKSYVMCIYTPSFFCRLPIMQKTT